MPDVCQRPVRGEGGKEEGKESEGEGRGGRETIASLRPLAR